MHAGEVPVAFVTLAPGATATAEELRAWAAERVPEQAAAPKAVTVLDALPVTPVGKPFKPALRAEATRRGRRRRAPRHPLGHRRRAARSRTARSSPSSAVADGADADVTV